MWLSLVERLVRDQEVASSNLVTPTIGTEGFPQGDPSVSMGPVPGLVFAFANRILFRLRRMLHSDQISTAIMIRNGIVKAVLIFCSKALIYKDFLVLENEISVRIKIISILSTVFLRT